MGMVDNLRCSLLRAGMRNVLHWAIDIQTHDRLVAAGLMSFFMPGIKGSPSKLVSSAPTLADVLVAIDGNVAKSGSSAADSRRMLAVPTDHVTLATLPRSYSGIMYFRNSERSKRFVDEIIRRLASDLLLTDLDALREVDARTRVHFLDQLEFISGDLFFGDLGLLPEDFTGFKVIHTGGGYPDASYMMKKHELWFLDSEGRCAAAQNGIISGDGIAGKNLPATSDETRYNDAVQNEIAKAGQAGGAGGGAGGAGAGAMNGKDISHLLDSN
ncbi:hypothetical protein BASA81_016111 [Batrachochytrium salamandrivorans]|nr:hypothetical protein BASA81_016111 [Batrachochytrium salamandrivorans]